MESSSISAFQTGMTLCLTLYSSEQRLVMQGKRRKVEIFLFTLFVTEPSFIYCIAQDTPELQ